MSVVVDSTAVGARGCAPECEVVRDFARAVVDYLEARERYPHPELADPVLHVPPVSRRLGTLPGEPRLTIEADDD